MRTTLKTTTAVLACLNLAVPYPALAQTGGGGTDASSICASDPESQECRDAVARGLSDEQDQSDTAPGAEGQAGDAAPAAPEAAAPPPEPGSEAAPTAPAATEPPPEATEDAAPAAPADPMAPAAPAAPEPATPEAVEPQPEAGQDVAPEDGNTAAPAADEGASQQTRPAQRQQSPDADAADAPVAGEPEGETPAAPGDGVAPAGSGAEAPDASGPQGETQSDAGADASTAAQPAPPATGEEAVAPSDGGQAADGTDASEATAAPQADAADGETAPSAPDAQSAGEPGSLPGAETAAPDQTGGDSQPTGNRDQAQPADPAAPGGAAARGDNQAAQQEQAPTAGGGAQQEAEAGSLAATAAASEEAEAQDVTTETVTEENARSSSEDFATTIDQSPEASSDDDEDDGLSKLEKALLLGAGALAVGTIMRNGREVVASSDDRVVVSGADGGYELIKDDNALLRRPGSEVQTETFDDGSTRTIVNRPDGSQIVTIRDPQLRVVRRVRVLPGGQQVVLIDDTEAVQPVDTSALQVSDAPTQTYSEAMDRAALEQALAANQEFGRTYSLAQVRSIEQVRDQVPAIDLENITFATGSAAIPPEQARQLTQLGQYIASQIEQNPREIFLVEGHTDAVGDGAYNLALSDRRAESVALALTEYFDVPPENLVVQGYGEQFLKVQTETAEQANRRASIRRITPLLQSAAAQ